MMMMMILWLVLMNASLVFVFSPFSFFDCRYVRVLGAFYMRLTGTVTDVYQYLEPLYNDYRKLRQRLADGRKISFFFIWIVLDLL